MSLISPLMPVPQSYHYFCYIALPLSTMYAVDRLYFCTPTAQLKQLSMGFYKIYLVSTRLANGGHGTSGIDVAHTWHITDREMRISR